VEPSENWLNVVRSEERWVDESRLDDVEQSVTKGKVRKECGKDRYTGANEERGQAKDELYSSAWVGCDLRVAGMRLFTSYVHVRRRLVERIQRLTDIPRVSQGFIRCE
jgi:hypothetical protein